MIVDPAGLPKIPPEIRSARLGSPDLVGGQSCGGVERGGVAGRYGLGDDRQALGQPGPIQT